MQDLVTLHPDEYRSLFAQHRDEIFAEAGHKPVARSRLARVPKTP